MEKEEYAFFLDISGSVGGSSNYWDQVDQLMTLYGAKTTKWYFWGSSTELVDKKRYEKAIKEKKGWSGTSPECVAMCIIENKLKDIVLVTDGQVGDHSVRECDRLLENYKLNKSHCYIISTDYGEPNMSVTCPFTRGCENEVYSKRRDAPIQKLVKYTPQDFKMLDSLEEITLENFDSKYELLQGLIISLNMGKEGNIPLKNQIVLMKNRLVKELSKSIGGNSGEEIRAALESKDTEKALEITTNMVKTYFNDDNTSTVEKKVSHLINLCGDLRGRYNINEIKSNKMAIAKNAEKGELDKEVETMDLSKNPIECPIILDEDVPQILIDECEPILLGLEKNIVDDIVACPLRILNYPEVKEKLKSKLSNYVGVKYGDKFLKNPFTQNKLMGAIPLGTHHSHVKVGNFTLAKLLTGGRVLGNLNMYYAVVWQLIKEGNIQYLKDIEKNAEEHMIFRLKNSKTMASLCGLAQFVTTEVPSDVAVWYCVNSGYFNQPTDKDTFRFHIFNLDPLIDMCKILGYPVIKGTEEHIRRTKAFMSLLSLVKKLDTRGKVELKRAMQCLYQKAIILDFQEYKPEEKFAKLQTCIKYIPIDGEATKEQVEQIVNKLPSKILKQLPVEQLYYLSTLADPQKSAADIFLDFNLKVPELPKFKVEWSYGLKEFPSSKVHICPKTLRPFYHLEGKNWQEVAEKTYKVKPKEMLQGHKYFEHFILKHRRLPSCREELTIFWYNRYIEAGKKNTLPYLTWQWAKDIIEDYREVLYDKYKEEFKFDEVKEIIWKSLPIKMRLQLEEEYNLK